MGGFTLFETTQATQHQQQTADTAQRIYALVEHVGEHAAACDALRGESSPESLQWCDILARLEAAYTVAAGTGCGDIPG